MTEWLLSGHNTQETLGITAPTVATMSETELNARIIWFLTELAGGDTSNFDQTLVPNLFVQGRWYLNINYFVRNMGTLLPFAPESLGAPPAVAADLEKPPRTSLMQRLGLPVRFVRVYREAANYFRHDLPDLNRTLTDIYWQLREEPENPLPSIWSLFEPELWVPSRDNNRAHIVMSLTIAALESPILQNARPLLSLLAGQATATSLIGHRIWELRQTAEACGSQVTDMLQDGIVELDAYRALPEATLFVAGVEEFLREYGHRGFRHEGDWAAERLADQPEHVLLALAGQLSGSEPPEVRAEASRQVAREALQQMNPIQRAVWQRVLRWGQQMISWREESKSFVAVYQAAYGLAARLLARHFYPDYPDDMMMFYTIDEFLNFARTQGEQRVDQEILDRRRAEFELYHTQQPPPELIWYDPATRHWRPALEEEEEAFVLTSPHLQGIGASAGSGLAEGIAVVTNDPLDAGRRLLKLEGPAVLVTRLTDPAWSALFRRLSAVVTELGGVISHAAIVARENGLPAVVGIPQVTRLVRDGQRLRVDGANGVVDILD
jgi:phosphohistidine swiveling domain-containing protein